MSCSATTSDTITRLRADLDAFAGVDITTACGAKVSDLLGRVTGFESWASAAQAQLINRADILAKTAPPPPRPGPAPDDDVHDGDEDAVDDSDDSDGRGEDEPEAGPGGEADSESTQDRLTGAGSLSEAEARRKRRRADLLKQLSGFHIALIASRITIEHIDAIIDLIIKMVPRERDEFIKLANHSSLEEIAAGQTIEEFARTLQELLAQMREETPDQKLQRQQLLSFLNMWDNKDGMLVINAELDPELGNRFREMIEADLRTLWSANRNKAFPIPDGVRDKHGWLRAQALLHRLTGSTSASAPTSPGPAAPAGASRSTRTGGVTSPTKDSGESPPGASSVPETGVALGPPAELVLFADYHKLVTQLSATCDDPVGHFGNGTPVGASTVRRLACDAHVLPMIFKPDGEPLDNGQRSRTANRAQRRALQKMYGGCMFCRTPFNWCQIHHFWHWLDHGPSALWNLGPVCNNHHHQIHDNAHQITRNPNGTLNLETASGRIIATTSVAHPQPPPELNISPNYQPPCL